MVGKTPEINAGLARLIVPAERLPDASVTIALAIEIPLIFIPVVVILPLDSVPVVKIFCAPKFGAIFEPAIAAEQCLAES